MERYTIDTRDVEHFEGLNFNLGIGEDFATNLCQEQLFNNGYMEKIKEEKINSIIDYEKHMFYPAYSIYNYAADNGNIDVNGDGIVMVQTGNTTGTTRQLADSDVCDIQKITFSIYLRERVADSNNDYGSWDPTEQAYWNRWDGSMTSSGMKKKVDDEKSTESYGDLLGYLGFTDDDVFYQKNKLKKSFLRISIYDSPYRQTQKLLYYSTLFFDTNVLYKKYTNLISKYPTIDDNELRVYQSTGINSSDKLTALFTCTPNFDNSACSDGFYLYLFNTIVNGGQCTPLYMKVEFNNAKYGKTVPLMMPTEKTGLQIIPIWSNDFPSDFEVNYGNEGHTYIDINKLYHDLYIPIFVRYNNTKNRFEWFIANNDPLIKRSNVTLKLYEPRINNGLVTE